ncbi:MAG: hypothetical protein KDD22_07955 [Bdellovibrionales bacterium]|nr:hypothetical protein [Bdellovibrionales bacterium]
MESSVDRVTKPEKRENPFINLAFNLVIPIFILEKAAHHLGENGPLKALLIAISFPVIYGIYDRISRKKTNLLSIFGLISVVVTGGLAVLQADGIWFAISEASLPLLLGLGVMASAFTKKPFVSALILNDSVMDLEKLNHHVQTNNKEADFKGLLKKSTLLFSVSFFISAILNFFLARHIFVPLATDLTEEARAQAINGQLAELRYYSIFVIMLPMFAFTALVLWHLFTGLRKSTGLKMEDLMRT